MWAWLDPGRWLRQATKLRLAVQDWAERFWAVRSSSCAFTLSTLFSCDL